VTKNISPDWQNISTGWANNDEIVRKSGHNVRIMSIKEYIMLTFFDTSHNPIFNAENRGPVLGALRCGLNVVFAGC
jgi:hypothetical protein